MWKLVRPHDGTKDRAGSAQRNTVWHAVSVVATPKSCISARALGSQRFLSAQAPPVPLPDCSHPESCPCAYKHHADRRSSSPRRFAELTGLRRSGYASQERRRDPGRRESD